MTVKLEHDMWRMRDWVTLSYFKVLECKSVSVGA